MTYFWKKHKLSHRLSATFLIFLHLLFVSPIRDALAFNAQSTSYRLSSGALTQGGIVHSGVSAKIWQGTLAEPVSGKSLSQGYILNSGFIPTIQANPPVQTQVIPNFTWKENESMSDAFDLDNYFVSPEGLALTYTVSGANKINVEIKPSYTKLLLHSDGIDGSTNFTDITGHAVFANGDAQIDTSQYKFGEASALFDGTGDYITAPASVDWNFNGDFTIDFWWKGNGLNTTLIKSVTTGTNGTESTGDWILFTDGNGWTTFAIWGGGNAGGSAAILTAGAWYHIAVIRSGSTTSLYINGIQKGTTISSGAIFGNTNILNIGQNEIDLTVGLNGWLDELRISKGIARWTANFTPPTEPYSYTNDFENTVSFSQPQAWFGTEKIKFKATDSEGNFTESNEISLQVIGVNNPPVLDYIPDITANENNLVKITPHATDADGDSITYSFSSPFNANGEWQTNYTSAGVYTITVTATDPTNLTDTQVVKVTVSNVNRAPVLNPIAGITVSEGNLATITPVATDPDNDAITLYYSSPFDITGKWLTDYDDAGTYNITVTASDGIDTVSQNAKVIVQNTNRPPQVSLTASKYTVNPNETFTITLSATDPDSDTMIFSLKKDSEIIASGNLAAPYVTTISFSAIGDHNISATVTDSGNLSTTDTKGIDVVDPNADRDSINPVMGDFNGDALSDLGLHNAQDGKWEICISDAGVFRNAVDWLNNFGTSRDWWPVGGDFNGDGKTDVGIYNNTSGELKIATSTGSGFTVQGLWLTFSSASYAWQPFTGNFNADKYTDFALYNKDTGEVRVALGTGTGFSAFTTWVSGIGNGYIALSGDFNGDSISDLCLFKKSSGEFKIVFSNTKAFVDASVWISGFASDKDALISDFNNDGLADVGYWDKTNQRWYYAISTGKKFVDKGTWLENFGQSSDESASTGDFNGDGITDAACFNKDAQGIDRWTVQLSSDKPADLLTQIDNGIGGKIQITYTYASQYANDLLPFPVYVTSSTSLVNTVNTSATYTQNFTYSGGYFDATEREFRGFRSVRVTDPITNNYTETYFYQGKSGEEGALKGQIEKIIAYDGNAKQISQSINTYEVKKAGQDTNCLGFPSLIKTETTVWGDGSTSLTTRNAFTYDNIGNVTEAKNEGDIAKTGDERIASITYSQAYEGFNRPIESLLKDKDGAVVTKKTAEYDDRGNLSRETSYIYNPLTKDEGRGTMDYSYDSFGNLTSTTDSLGRTVTTEYDTDFYAYPVKVTNALGHTVTQIYNTKLGVVTSVTDTNGSTSQTTYDSLGRVVRGTRDEGGGTQVTVVTYSYPDFNTKITTNALGLTKTEYIDGLGRNYKTVSVGENNNQPRQIAKEVFYNNRGQTSAESLPHYIDENSSQISYVRYEYDIRGRIKKTTSDFPGTAKDAYGTISYINPLYVETTDPQGHKKGTKKDVYGSNIEITEFTQGGVYKTTYAYDIQNNLTQVTDNQNNITQIFYDSAGKKLKMIDPDMGTWLYEYDILGNLTKQTDAKNQVITFIYDELNRLSRKTMDDGRRTKDEVNYTYDDTGKENCIGRLSKVTDTSGSTEFFYDKLGREIKSTKTVSGSTYQVSRTYDILDRLTALTYPDNTVVNYSYDSNSGLLEKVYSSNFALPSSNFVTDINYNAKGQIKAISYGNNTQTTYTYGQDLRLSNILTSNQTSTLQDLNYIFDKNGNITTLTDNLKSNIRTYSYDELDRLTQASNVPALGSGYTTFNYQYDSIGNMTYKSDLGVMTYGQNAGPHAVTSAGGYTYQYDANGNMTVGKQKTLTYDVQNRLTSIVCPLSSETYAYDGDGGRVRKTIDDGGGTIKATTYIGSLYEVESDGKLRKHIFAGSTRVCTITSNLALPSSPVDCHYYHGDHLGSSSVITDELGNKVATYEYTPYGKVAQQTGSDITNYKFTGKELDSTGLYYYGARYYDPEIGRFIMADTIVQAPYDPQSLNRYSYCRNNPLNYVDPTGHFWWVAALIFVAIAATIGAVANIAIAGATGQLTSWTAFWAAFSSGAAAGAVAGMGAFVPGAGTILGGILIGAVAGGIGGAVHSSTSGAFSWGAVAMSASFGGVLGGFGNSGAGKAVGRFIGKGIGKLPFGQHIQRAGQAFSNKMTSLYYQAKGMTVGGALENSLDYSKGEVWHATTEKDAASIMTKGAYGGEEGNTFVFNPDEVVNGVRLRGMNAEQLQQALAIDHKIDTIIHMPRNTIVLQPAPNGAYTGGQASQAILYGAGGKNVGPYSSWYTTSISEGPRVLLGPLINAQTGEILTEGDF